LIVDRRTVLPKFNSTFGVFTSAKTPRSIRVGGEAFRDALIRATLDPAIRSIERFPELVSECDIAMVARIDGLFAYGVARHHVPARVWTDPAGKMPLGRIMLTERDIYRAPAITNERLVWSHRGRRVSNGLRIQIIHALTTEGPTPIAELVARLRIPARSAAGIFAMACADLVELPDIAFKPLGPESIVSFRASGCDGR